MAISNAVRTYYAERIFARTTRTEAPPNFRSLEGEATGIATVEGCRGGGKNVLEVRLIAGEDTVRDVRMICGLCSPAMMVAADVLADWARGRALDAVLGLDATADEALDPFFERLGGRGRPDDAREKFQYALLAVQNAVRDHRGEPPLPLPEIDEPGADRDREEDRGS